MGARGRGTGERQLIPGCPGIIFPTPYPQGYGDTPFLPRRCPRPQGDSTRGRRAVARRSREHARAAARLAMVSERYSQFPSLHRVCPFVPRAPLTSWNFRGSAIGSGHPAPEIRPAARGTRGPDTALGRRTPVPAPHRPTSGNASHRARRPSGAPPPSPGARAPRPRLRATVRRASEVSMHKGARGVAQRTPHPPGIRPSHRRTAVRNTRCPSQMSRTGAPRVLQTPTGRARFTQGPWGWPGVALRKTIRFVEAGTSISSQLLGGVQTLAISVSTPQPSRTERLTGHPDALWGPATKRRPTSQPGPRDATLRDRTVYATLPCRHSGGC
jgi:hypothetical protein